LAWAYKLQIFCCAQTRTQWWTDKINGNKAKDEKAIKALKKGGWKVIVVWECKLKSIPRKAELDKLISFLQRQIKA